MRRPDGFDFPSSEEERRVDPVDELAERRRERKRRSAEAEEQSGTTDAVDAPAPARRWALSAYALEDDDGAEPRTPDADAVAANASDADEDHPLESHAARVDREYRAAQRERAAKERADAAAAKRAARAATKARRKREHAEVRRFTAAARRRTRIGVLTALGLALSLLLLVGLVWSPLMAVREVRVTGTERLDASTVREALADQLGQPIASVSEADVAARLAEIRPIESFQLDVVPPSTIIVRIVERTPVAIATVHGSEQAIDAAGVPLGAPEDGAALPRLDGIELGSEAFEAVASVLVSIPDDVRSVTTSIAAPSPEDIRLELASGQTVAWGGAEDSALKADVVAALLATQDPEASAEYDVRAPEHPVVRGRETP